MRTSNLLLTALLLGTILVGRANALSVTISSTSGQSFPVGATITFNAAITNGTLPAGSTFHWDFDDTTTADTTVPTVNHVFTVDDTNAVSVQVNNAGNKIAFDFDFFEAIVAPPSTAPAGIDAGDPDITNPDDGITFKLNQAQAGFIEATLSLDAAHSGSNDDFLTDFGDQINGVENSGRKGSHYFHKYRSSGIFILESDHTQNGAIVGKSRKTLAFAQDEIFGAFTDPLVKAPSVPLRKLSFKSVKGKFNFKANSGAQKPAATAPTMDSVTLTWMTTLPAGFDITSQMVSVSVGNISDVVQVTPSGKATILTGSSFKSVQFKLPKLKKGQTRPATATPSMVTVQLLSQDLPSQGFDTEGITPKAFDAKNPKAQYSRTIQVATVFAGVSYSGIANVNLSYTSNADFGTISGRASK